MPSREVLSGNRATKPIIAMRPLINSRPDVKMKLPFLGVPLKIGTKVATVQSRKVAAMGPG